MVNGSESHVLNFIFVFFLRRALLSIVVVYTMEFLVLQIFTMNMTIVASLYIIGTHNPYKKRTQN